MWIALLPLLAPTELEVARPAPEHEVETWQESRSAEEGSREVRIVRRSSKTPSPDGGTLAELAGQVVLLYWVDEDRERLQLVADLLRCNTDRDLTAIGLAAPDDGDSARNLVGDHDLTHPIGLITPEETPYGGVTLAVVGRAGGLAWSGDPLADEKEFLGALSEALDTWPAPRLEHDFDEQLGDALEHYYAGRWARARKAAKKAARKSPEGAAYLLGRLEEHERELSAHIPTLTGPRHHLELALLTRALERGLPRGELEKACEEQIAEAKKTLSGISLVDGLTWAELQGSRPALFPARRDAAGRRFAKKLAPLTRTAHDTEVTRLVRAMLEEFEG